MQHNADYRPREVENTILAGSTALLRRTLSDSFPKRPSAGLRSADGRLKIGEKVASCRRAERALSSPVAGNFVPDESPN
ncbi:hypothetical protein CSOJ01_12700 [Colletotrichum sojae]|uniref:Uncharacterized protein n=1 Tax=Colletotrichum sojae TaxID=2175907 RepID=A0A8H6MM17_9PEZI|nr:hypothetical protein CSOJ01_12700 [Colletotrichum sojae]